MLAVGPPMSLMIPLNPFVDRMRFTSANTLSSERETTSFP
jgi:hypothetical protein